MNVANVICGGLLHMNKKNQYTDSVKETLILTLAVAIIAAAVYFFLVPSHASVSSILESFCQTLYRFHCQQSL